MCPMNKLQLLLIAVREPLEYTDLDTYSGTIEPFWKSRAEKLQNTVGEKITKHREDGCMEKGKRHSFTFSKSAFPPGGTPQCQESPSWPPVSPTGESKCIVECPTSPLCWMLPEAYVFLIPPRVPRHEMGKQKLWPGTEQIKETCIKLTIP